MKRLCILAIPRSGTNHLCKVIGSLKGVRSHFELFSKDASYSVDKREINFVSKAAGTKFTGFRDPELVAYARENPAKYLNLLEKADQDRFSILSYKIFPGHLQTPKLQQDIFKQGNTTYIIVRRKLIDAYISLHKAMQTGKFVGHDTSGMEVTLDASKYIRWAGTVASWYITCEAALKKSGAPHFKLSYEEDISLEPKVFIEQFTSALKAFGLETEIEDENVLGLVKQDKSTNYRAKVRNWDAFVDDLHALGMLPQGFADAAAPEPVALL